MHAGTREETNGRIHVVNSHGDRVTQDRRRDHSYSANSLWERVACQWRPVSHHRKRKRCSKWRAQGCN